LTLPPQHEEKESAEANRARCDEQLVRAGVFGVVAIAAP
jgi:hypothetical protein